MTCLLPVIGFFLTVAGFGMMNNGNSVYIINLGHGLTWLGGISMSALFVLPLFFAPKALPPRGAPKLEIRTARVLIGALPPDAPCELVIHLWSHELIAREESQWVEADTPSGPQVTSHSLKKPVITLTTKLVGLGELTLIVYRNVRRTTTRGGVEDIPETKYYLSSPLEARLEKVENEDSLEELRSRLAPNVRQLGKRF